MTSERIRRRIDRLLDEAEEALTRRDWGAVRNYASDVLALDPGNQDATAFVAASERASNAGPGSGGRAESAPLAPPEKPAVVQPSSFADGRYKVQRSLGEGGKKRVYLAHDSVLDRDVAIAVIKTEGLDDASSLPHLPRGPGPGPARRPSPHHAHSRLR